MQTARDGFVVTSHSNTRMQEVQMKNLRRSLLGGAVAAALALPLVAAPAPAQAHWHHGGWHHAGWHHGWRWHAGWHHGWGWHFIPGHYTPWGAWVPPHWGY